MSASRSGSGGGRGRRRPAPGRAGIVASMAVVGVALVVGGLALFGGENGTKPAALPDPGGVPSTTLFGVHTKVEDKTIENLKTATLQLEAGLGRTIDINHHFYPWDKEFPTAVERWDLEQGRLPMISWNGRGAFARDIAAGKHDPLIQDRAIRVRELERPVLIRWFWEMDGNKKARWAQEPADYVAAWRHIVDLFDDQRADNVSWVWCPNASAFEDGEAQAFYPGPDHVDWICGDGYNWAPGRERDRWETFEEIFTGFYGWASQQGKPIMVGEFGVQERGPGEKAEWISQMAETIKNEFPRLGAIVYFNANQDHDWRVTTSPEAFEAFREVANDVRFGAARAGRVAGDE